MNCNPIPYPLRRDVARWIATFAPLMTIVSGLSLYAEALAIRFSAPPLGWVLAADGLQLIELTGLADSPRAGRRVTLPGAAQRAWPAPDASTVLLRLDSGVFLLRSGDNLELLQELPPGVSVQAAWDRRTAGFAMCWQEICEARSRTGAVLQHWDVPGDARVLAFSATAGMVAGARWYRDGGSVLLEEVPTAAAFRPDRTELWILSAKGQLRGLDAQGGQLNQLELFPRGIGLVPSLDGKFLFAVSEDGAAAVVAIDDASTKWLALEESAEGLWPGPGPFTVRFHESTKRPIAFWTAESVSFGWAPIGEEVIQ